MMNQGRIDLNLRRLAWGVALAAFAIMLTGRAAADSLSCRFVGNWPFGESYAVAVDTARSLVFCGSGGGVFILDLSDPEHLPRLSDLIRTRGFIYGLSCYRNWLFLAAEDAGLEIWDVSDAAAPVRLGSLATSEWVYGVAVSGDYAYLVGRDSSLRIADISDPAHPYEVSRHHVYGRAYAVSLSGDYAYVAAYNGGLSVVDVSDPRNPEDAGHCRLAAYAEDVVVLGSYAYVSDAGLRVVDISNPRNPISVASRPAQWAGRGVAASQGYVYFGVEDSFLVFDVSEPSSPNLVGCCRTPSYIEGICLAGGYALVADHSGGLRLIDVSDPHGPFEVGYIQAPGVSGVAKVVGSCAFAADNGLRIFDVSDPRSPRDIGYCPVSGNTYGIAISDRYAYLASWQGGLRVLDISNLQSPREVGHASVPGLAYGVAVSGEYVYVGAQDSGLRVIDVSDPSSPTEVGRCSIPSRAFGVCMFGTDLCLVTSWSGLSVVSVADPRNPVLIGSCPSPRFAMCVAVSGSYAYVGGVYAHFNVVDVTNPYEPVEVGHDTAIEAQDVAVSGTYVYVAAAGDGLRVISVADPRNPREVGYYTMPHPASRLAASATIAYVCAGALGVYEFYGLDVEERRSTPDAVRAAPIPTILRGCLRLPTQQTPAQYSLLSVDGRKVMQLHPGPNDVSGMRSGVYFVRLETPTLCETRKVILAE
jgi:hypothetical protein